ncbi:Carbonic anhydrase 2 [Micractinium conductrix]|uniref:Carbonic anhydrase 2 n=1 Tax=Micractinium conductrix TaxID=554055 RepID=A0A2P6V400_9CHLO|nr:Carbonic anhydrase 2 [Micractinium conductrix]|eukprot:PSC68818.1 Carbonic anhydrase 2 [Micractinium conductrix]
MEGWPESAAFPGLPPELTDDPLRGFIDFGGLALPPAAHEAGAATVPPPPLEGGFSLPPLQFEAMPPDGFSVPMPPLPPGQADTRMPPSELYPTGSGGGSSGGGGGGGSGGGVLAPAGGRQQCTAALTEEAKLERSRAQNRAKQARFRERQKEKREQMEQQYDSVSQDLERERQLNESMKLSGSLLDAVKQQKDAAVGILHAAAGRTPPALDADGAQQALCFADSSCGVLSGPAGAVGATLAAQFRALSFEARVEICTSIFHSSDGAKRVLKQTAGEHGERLDGFALDFDSKRAMGDHMLETHPQLLEAALALSDEDVLQEWADLGEAAAKAVAAVDNGVLTEEEAVRRMHPATMYQAIRNSMLLLHKPQQLQHLITHNRYEGESEEAATARWRRVMAAMHVPREACATCLPAYESYCDRVRQLGEEAASAVATLQEVQQSMDRQIEQLGDSSLNSMVRQYLTLAEATGKLEQAPTLALLATMDFYAAAGSVTTPMQKLRMTATCRPLHPDVVAIVREGLKQFSSACCPRPRCCTPRQLPPGLDTRNAAMMLVQQLSVALEAAHAAAEPFVGAAYREVPAFVALYGLVFFAALPFWRYIVGVDTRRAAILSSCCMSSLHGILSALGGYQQLMQWHGFHLDLPNTLPQKLLNEFSLAYMIADLFFFLLPFTPDDFVFLIHHVISSVYLVGCLNTGHGAISCVLMFFLGEVTSPIFNTFSMSKELRHHSKAAFRVFTFTSPLFTIAFVGVRSVIAPPVVGWFVYTLWFRSTLIPTAWRVTMGTCVSLGMVASQLWSFKLLRGYTKQHRRVQQLADAKKQE